jgi:hypothetical protein
LPVERIGFELSKGTDVMWLKISVSAFGYLLVSALVVVAVLVIIGQFMRVILWAAGAKDLVELSARMDAASARSHKSNAEWREQRRARGAPATLGTALKLLGWRMWPAYTHPIRAWRGEFDPPKKDVRGAGGNKL